MGLFFRSNVKICLRYRRAAPSPSLAKHCPPTSLGQKILKLKLPPAATTTYCDRWDRSNSSKKNPAVPPGLAHILKTRPLVAYIHTPAFGNGEPLLRLAYSAFAFPLALRSPFGIAMLCRDFTARGSLKNRIKAYLLFLNGFVHCSTAARPCQGVRRIIFMHFHAFLLFIYSCISGSASTNFSFICLFSGLMLIVRMVLGTSN